MTNFHTTGPLVQSASSINSFTGTNLYHLAQLLVPSWRLPTTLLSLFVIFYAGEPSMVGVLTNKKKPRQINASCTIIVELDDGTSGINI